MSASTSNYSVKNNNTPADILLVEDSKTTATMLSKFLEDRYSLVKVKNGAVAWEMINTENNIGLVLTDINMPEMTGHQLLVEIRRCKNPRINKIPVIVMTDADDNTDRDLAFSNGASDFINKPIDEIELTARVNVHYTLSSTIRELEASREALQQQATTDPLTKLENRRAFFDQAGELLALHNRYGSTYSVLMLDIDYFKKINDNHGHDGGDKVLIAIAGVLQDLTRGVDTVARIGGEEFAILLPDTNRLGSAVMAERVRSAIEQHNLDIDGTRLTVTVSIGIASQDAEHTDSVRDLMRIADKRLYLAKGMGRNRIAVNDEGKPSYAA
ncbi:MAG: diguanylate cyclase [Acidiferrobacterales bacterium]